MHFILVKDTKKFEKAQVLFSIGWSHDMFVYAFKLNHRIDIDKFSAFYGVSWLLWLVFAYWS